MTTVVRRIIEVVCFLCLFVGCGKLWRFILVDDTQSYTRIMMHQLYTCENDIDVLFVGSSHVYRSIIPESMDKELKCYTFNVGSSSQALDGSFAIIKEAAKRNNLKHVYLECYYGVAMEERYIERSDLTSTYIISDYMKFSLDKINYLVHASSKKYWVNSFIVARRNWTKFGDIDYIKALVSKKTQDTYKRYEYVKADGVDEYYVDRGFVASDMRVSNDILFNETAYNAIDIDFEGLKKTDWASSLSDIVTFCNKKGIEITLFMAPEPEWTLVGTGDYSKYSDVISKFANLYGVEFYDFNLCRDEVFDANERGLFKDEDHLNKWGAQQFSQVFSNLIMGKQSEKEIFYNNFDEKILDKNIAFYGIAGPFNNDETRVRRYRIISGNPTSYEYRIKVLPSMGKERLIQDFNDGLDFELPANESGEVTIEWRSIENRENVYSEKIAY